MSDINGDDEPIEAIQEAGPEKIAGKKSPEWVKNDLKTLGPFSLLI